MLDYIPDYPSPAVAKGRATRRRRWERLLEDPRAWAAMRQIVALERERRHAELHRDAWWYRDDPCWDVGCAWRDPDRAAAIVAGHDALLDGCARAFCRRYDVTLWYLARFRRLVLDAEATADSPPEPGLSAADRAQLREWLAGQRPS